MGGPGDECSPEIHQHDQRERSAEVARRSVRYTVSDRAQTVDSQRRDAGAVDQARLENDSGELHRVVLKHLFTQSIQRLPAAECLLMSL